MAKVGPIMTTGNAAYCEIKLDSGERILVKHDRAGFMGGRLTIERLKLMGFSAEIVFEIDLDSSDGKAALGTLTKGVSTGGVATPLGAFVSYVRGGASLADVVTHCRLLGSRDAGAR